MNESINWDDLRLFLSVARHNGLSGAAQDTGLSGPTLGRRMTALERSLGEDLFRRHARGYDLTEAGKALFARGIDIAKQVEQIAPEQPVKRVKISAGVWTTKLLCLDVSALQTNGITVQFVAADQVIDILHRAALIGIRNHRPNQIGLAGQKVGTVQFAIYGTGDDWVQVIGNTPSARWVAQQQGPKIEITHAANALDLVTTGSARAVLPTFIGDREPNLPRLSGPIEGLTHDQWVVSHESDRHQPEVRHCLTQIVKRLKTTLASQT